MKQLSLGLLLTLIILGGCRVEEKIVDGQTAYERRQYAKAIQLLEKEYNKSKLSSERGKKAFLIAESYRIINQPQNSKDWYYEAYNSAYGAEALKQYAFALKELEQYKDAIEAFRDLGGEIGDPYKYQREIVACRQASTWAKFKNKSDYKVEDLKFNSNSADYYPVVFKDNQLIITSDRNVSTGEDTYNWTGNDFSDLFIVENPDNSGSITSFSEAINSPYNEGTITFNQDYTEAYFSRCGDGSNDAIQYCKLMYSQLVGGEWTVPIVLDFIENEVNYGHPSLSKNGQLLYFSSDHPIGLGGFDLYVAQRKGDGWDEPKNLGRAINTEGNEISPFIDADTLYFASDFHVGMGGLDIFKTAKMSPNRWGPLQNLRAPINSGADDFGLVIDYRPAKDEKVLQTGYFTSARPEGKGNDDIYRFQKMKPVPEPEPVDTPLAQIDTAVQEEPEIVYTLLLEGKVVERVFFNPNDPNSGVEGKSPLANANVLIQYRDTSFSIATNAKGEFKLELEQQTSYTFTGSKTDYLTKEERFSTRGIENDPNNPTQTFYTEIALDKVLKNVEIKLEGIYYDYDQDYIRPDAKPILNNLASILIRNPQIRIELGSHTDCRGSNSYNQKLSQRRAASAVDYLVSKGIARERMVARGYGETVAVTSCACSRCSDDEHQRNRRTSFKIID